MKATIINQVIILALIMGVGLIARKKGMLSAEVNSKLSDFLLNVTLPCLIVTSFNFEYSAEMMKNIKLIFFYSVLIHTVLIFLSRFFAFRFSESSRKVIRFVTVFSNSGFMGFPVLFGLYGNIGVFYGAVFNVPWNIFMLSFGSMLFTGKKDLKSLRRVITHPGIIATAIGMLMFVFSLSMPLPLEKALVSVGSMTTPLSMIIVGSMLAEIKLKEVFSGFAVYYVSAVRLIAAPLLTLAILRLLNADQMLTEIAVTVEAMPAAVIATVLASKFDGDTKLASRCVFISTIISMITIPLIVMNI
ncbi:MAG: auxin efflux carrier family protein [Firmicutes bacterium]|nr:auxin efflux carrier family protein [Bacillota bacterium]